MPMLAIEKKATELLHAFTEPKAPSDEDLRKISQRPGFSLADLIDHTVLKTEAEAKQIENLVAEAFHYQLKAVCVQPGALRFVEKAWQKSAHPLQKAVVVGFPQGANLTSTKVSEIEDTLFYGVDEIDLVAPIYLIKSGLWQEVLEELKAARKACKTKLLKLIFETCLLTDLEIAILAGLALEAGVDCFKTSTGFAFKGADPHSVSLLHHLSQNKVFVKASGGIKTQQDALRMVFYGAKRLGTSSALSILSGK